VCNYQALLELDGKVVFFIKSRRFQLSRRKIDLRDTPASQDLMVLKDRIIVPMIKKGKHF